MNQPKKATTICPKCRASVREDHLERHLRKVHAPKSPARTIQPGTKPPKTKVPIAIYEKHLLPNEKTISGYKMEAVDYIGRYMVDEYGVVHDVQPISAVGAGCRRPGQPSPKPLKERTIKFSICPVCNKAIPQKKLKNHIRTIHNEKGKPSSQSKTVCPICHCELHANRLNRHVARVHSAPAKEKQQTDHTVNTLTPCPVCAQPVRQDRLQKHLSKVHMQTDKKQTPSARTNTLAGIANPAYTNASTQAAIDQEYNEPQDGGKYLGQMRRESSGQFGSLPLYDDYSEDAEA